MFEEYNQTVKTAKELSREDFESFEFQPKKKVREMFEKLMNSANEDEEDEEDEEEQEEHKIEDTNRKDGKVTAKKRKAAPTKKTNNSNNANAALLRMRAISATELACKLNSKHKDAEEKPTSSERILSQLLSTASTKTKSAAEKKPAAIPAKKKKKTKDSKEGEPAAGGKEEEEEEEEEEIDERLKLAREAIKAAKASRKVHKIKDHEGLKAVIEKRDFAGMVMEVEKTYKEGSKEAKAAEEKENLKGQKMSGLDALLAKIEKSKKMSVLDKTKMDWKKVKDSNEEIDEELEMHRKSKNTYTEQQSFLQQAEYREYEKERDARLAANARRGQGI
jgi:hypothetical protein